MPKTGYVLSEKEVARIHAAIDKAASKLVTAQEDLKNLKTRFPVSPAPSSNTVEPPIRKSN